LVRRLLRRGCSSGAIGSLSKAFSFSTGVWQALTPVRAAFSALAPVFSALGNGIKAVWEWFKNLLTPMQTSKDTLDKCASAGKPLGG
jgi:hypothetical protein